MKMSPARPPKDSTQDDTARLLPADAEQRLREDAGAIAETAKAQFADVKEEVEAEIGALAEEGKRQFDSAVDKAKGLATEQKNLLAEQLAGISSAVGKVADELAAEDAATAGYARTIANGVDRFTRTIKERDVDGLVAMAEDFGRKQPGAFMAAAAIAGFAASRFLVASAKRRDSQMPRRTGYDAASETDYATGTESGLSGDTGTRREMGGIV
jgi:hypothetical protein